MILHSRLSIVFLALARYVSWYVQVCGWPFFASLGYTLRRERCAMVRSQMKCKDNWQKAAATEGPRGPTEAGWNHSISPSKDFKSKDSNFVIDMFAHFLMSCIYWTMFLPIFANAGRLSQIPSSLDAGGPLFPLSGKPPSDTSGTSSVLAPEMPVIYGDLIRLCETGV